VQKKRIHLVPTASRPPPAPGRFPRPAKSRELRSPGAMTPSAGRGEPPRQLTALVASPGRLTRRLSCRSRSLHSATASPGHYPLHPAGTGCCSIPRSYAAGNRRDRRSPGQRITRPSSGNARKLAGLRRGPVMRWPPRFVWPLSRPHSAQPTSGNPSWRSPTPLAESGLSAPARRR